MCVHMHVRVVLVDEYHTTQMCYKCTDPAKYKNNPIPIANNPSEVITAPPGKNTNSRLIPQYYTSAYPNIVFRPMTQFKYDTMPLKRKQQLSDSYSHILSPQDFSEKCQTILSYPIHGLRQCSCCLTFHNRDHNAFKAIGNKGLDIMRTGKPAQPFDKKFYLSPHVQNSKIKNNKVTINRKRKSTDSTTHVHANTLDNNDNNTTKNKRSKTASASASASSISSTTTIATPTTIVTTPTPTNTSLSRKAESTIQASRAPSSVSSSLLSSLSIATFTTCSNSFSSSSSIS